MPELCTLRGWRGLAVRGGSPRNPARAQRCQEFIAFVSKVNGPLKRAMDEAQCLLQWLICLCIGICIMLVKMKRLSNRVKREVQALIDAENARILASGRKLQYKVMEQGGNRSYVYVRCGPTLLCAARGCAPTGVSVRDE